MRYSILYYSEQVQEDIMNLPDTLRARYIGLTNRMIEYGPSFLLYDGGAGNSDAS